MKLKVSVPGKEPQIKQIEYGFGVGSAAYFDLGIMKITAIGDRMFLTQMNVPDKYVEGMYDGDFGKSLSSIGGDQAAIRPLVPILMREGRGVNSYLEAFRFEIIDSLWIAGYDSVESKSGQLLHEIKLQAERGMCIVRFDNSTNFLGEIELEVPLPGSTEGNMIRGKGICETEILEKSEGLVAFETSGRTVVSSLGALETSTFNVGDQIPDFELPSLDGKTVRLSDLRGSVVVVDLWASWCIPCRRTLKHLQVFSDWAFEEKLPVIIYAVATLEYGAMADEKRGKVSDFWQSQGFTVNTLLDLDSLCNGQRAQVSVTEMFAYFNTSSFFG